MKARLQSKKSRKRLKLARMVLGRRRVFSRALKSLSTIMKPTIEIVTFRF